MPDNNVVYNTSKIRKVLLNEISVLVMVICGVFSFITFVILPIKMIEKDIETLRHNEIYHIGEQLNTCTSNNKAQAEAIVDINLKLKRIITILEEG